MISEKYFGGAQRISEPTYIGARGALERQKAGTRGLLTGRFSRLGRAAFSIIRNGIRKFGPVV